MARKSAGLLMYRRRASALEVLLAHPGGPYWAKKDLGAWSIPKGEYDEDESALEAAKREFYEETGFAVCEPLIFLGEVKQRSGKTVSAWAFESDCDPAAVVSNTFSMEWPPHSGKRATFPEIDRVCWFDVDEARTRINSGQVPFIDALERLKKCG